MAVTSHTPAIPEGSVVLITAANGYVGTAIADYFLERGLKVRGAVRSIERAAWVQAYFDKHYPGQYELVQVSGMTSEGTYDEAIKGASAVVHCASDVSFSANPNDVIPASIQGALNVLKSAFAEPSVKRFVLTSSWSAAAPHEADKVEVVTTESWGESSVRAAWADPPYEWQRALPVYAASKVQSEQEVWKYYRENKEKRPDLVVNTVLPNNMYGRILDPKSQGRPSSTGVIWSLYDGQRNPLHDIIGNQFHVDTVDSAALHYAAVAFPDVAEERVFASGEPFTWSRIIQLLKKNFPGKADMDEFESHGIHHTVEARPRGEELLRRLGHPGFKSLEQSLVETINSQ